MTFEESREEENKRKLKEIFSSSTTAGFKAASVPLTEGTVAAVGNVPGAVIVVTKKVAAVKAVQTGAAAFTQKR